MSLTSGKFKVLAQGLASELQNTSNQILDVVLVEVLKEVPFSVWGDREEIGQFYLTSHMLTMGQRKGRVGGISGESTGSMSKSYGGVSSVNGSLDLTSYGIEFQRIRRQLVISPFYVG